MRADQQSQKSGLRDVKNRWSRNRDHGLKASEGGTFAFKQQCASHMQNMLLAPGPAESGFILASDS